MGGAVSTVAGANWMLIGDAAACVNPLNGEGIDYGLETAAMAVSLLGGKDFTLVWPDRLRAAYGEAFVLARTAARLLTYPQFLPVAGPVALRGPVGRMLMPAAARLMGNLVTDEDRDTRMAELIREAALDGLHDELPHSVAVTIDEVFPDPEREGVLQVHAVIYVEREGQKAILRGKDGRRLSRTVHRARKEIIDLVGQNVYLDVRLKVAKNWQSDPKQLGRMGF